MSEIVLIDITKITNIKQYDEWLSQQKRLKSLEYYYENREELLEHRRIKIQCICGKIVSIGSFSTHKKTKCHIKYMKKLEKENNKHSITCCCNECV